MFARPSLSGASVATFKGQFLLVPYASQAAATSASASFARTSMSTMCESPTGDSRIVAGPRTPNPQPDGAVNVLPSTVVFDVSVAKRSRVASVG